MMQSFLSWRTRTAIYVLPFLALFGMASTVDASPIQYSTYSSIPPIAPGSPDPLIGFIGVANGTINGNAPFSLGEFTVKAPYPGGSVSYTDKPISVEIVGAHGDILNVSMILNGTIGAGHTAQLVVTSISPLYAIPTGGYIPPPPTTFEGIPINQIRVGGPIILDPSFNGGVIPIYAQVVPVPEPSVSALAFIVIGGWGFRRYRRSRRAPALVEAS